MNETEENNEIIDISEENIELVENLLEKIKDLQKVDRKN